MASCKRCGQHVKERDPHTFYAWDVTHECGHKVTYRAICDAHAFSSPQVGANTSTLIARITGEPCLWCGGEVYGKSQPTQKLPSGVKEFRFTDDERIAHLLAFLQT